MKLDLIRVIHVSRPDTIIAQISKLARRYPEAQTTKGKEALWVLKKRIDCQNWQKKLTE